MAEFEREDLFSDEFMNAPVDVKNRIDKLIKSCDALIERGVKMDKSFKSAASVSAITKEVNNLAKAEKDLSIAQQEVVIINDKITKSTKQLTLQEIELAKVTKQTEVAVAKQTKEYADQKKKLDEANKVTKERVALGDKEAKTVTATNASIKQLSAALSKNRADYEALTSAEQRNSEEGKELLATIQSQDIELKNLKKSMGQNQLEVGNYEGALKSLKEEMITAKDELAGIAATLGTSSPEYVAAAERAGQLQDSLNDVKEAVKDLSGGSGFERAGDQSKRFMDQFKAGDLKGATGTLKGLATTIQGLTFKESIAGAGGFLKQLGAVGKAILTNPLFLLAAVIVGIGVAVVSLKDKIPFLTKAFDLAGAALDYIVQKGKEFSDWALGSEFIIADKAEKQAEASKKEIEAIRERYDFEIAKAEAAGKDTLEIEKKKNAAIEREAKRALAELNKLENRTPEQLEMIKEFVKIVEKGHGEVELNEIKHQVELQKIRDAAAAERAKAEEAAWNERKKKLAEEAAAFKLGLADQRKLAERDFGKIGETINKGIKGRAEAFLKSIATTAKTSVETVKDRWIEGLEKIQAAVNTWGNAVGDLFAALTAGKLQDIDEEQKASEIANKERIQKEKDNLAKQLEDDTLTTEQRDQLKVESDKRTRALETAQEKRQLAFEQRRRAALRKQAIYEKALALGQAVIAGALAVAKALPAIPLALAAGALAAIQVAAIAARPIPAAAKGMKSHKGGLIRAGELGSELVRIPGKKPMLTDGDGIYNMPAGTEIKSHKNTVKWLANQGLASSQLDRIAPVETNLRGVEQRLDTLTRTIKNKPEAVIHGRVVGRKQMGVRTTYLNSLRNG